MITVQLQGHAEKIAPPGSYPDYWSSAPLYHQWRTWQALRDYYVVVNIYNTGTGKTRASLLRLIDLNGQRKHVLVIAPTNALISQHTEDIQKFVDEHGLDYYVMPVTAAEIRSKESGLRQGETLHRLIKNHLEFDPEAQRSQPVIVVTNPDIFYYALYFRYGKHDQRNLFSTFLSHFDYLVVDEFHYYNNKQLVNFLFTFAMYDEFGYFDHPDHERRVCLLSATPRNNVMKYLTQLFGDRLRLISPHNEPLESADFTTIPTLSPLMLQIQGIPLYEWVESHQSDLKNWVKEEDLDGVIISNSLARINQSFSFLRPYFDDTHMGRITGPESTEARSAATKRPLILATPTVDIGYNFTKESKNQRQNIDFVVCEAHFQDDLIQRIGRVGRVLGKLQPDIPSYAVVLVRENAMDALKALDGQTLSRAELAAFLAENAPMPEKHQLDSYIRHYAIQEIIRPIYELGKMLQETDELDQLYSRLCHMLAPKQEQRQKQWLIHFKKHEQRQRWLQEAQNSRRAPKHTATWLADWLEWQSPNAERPDPRGLQDYVSKLWKQHPDYKKAIISFVQSQVDLADALYNFRDSFQGPTVVFYDPQHQFSSDDVNSYDVFHLLSNYHLSAPMSKAQFAQHTGQSSADIPKAEFYFALHGMREERLVITFHLNSPLDQETFERRWCRVPVALRGLQLRAKASGGNIIAGAIPGDVESALEGQGIIAMILPGEEYAVVRSTFSGTEIWSRQLTINFEAEGILKEGYMLFLGLSAFEAHAELQSYFFRKDRLRPDAIIL